MANERFYQGPYWDNLGIALSSGVFTVQGALGRSLSTANPAYVVLPSQGTPGQFVKYTVTADQAFIDDVGSSEIIDNLFGLTTGVAYAQDIPFFIYAVPNDAETAIQFMISRVPHAKQSPAAADIGAPDDAVADAQGDFFSFDNINEAIFDTNPCLCVGSMRMRMTSSDDWTVQALDDLDGIGQFNDTRDFTFPLAVFGAATGTFMLANGGTAPLFTNNQYVYRLNKEGFVQMDVVLTLDPGTDGVGAVNALLSIPYIASNSVPQNLFVAYGRNVDIVNGTDIALFQASQNNNYTFIMIELGAFIQNGDYANGSRSLLGNFHYKIRLT